MFLFIGLFPQTDVNLSNGLSGKIKSIHERVYSVEKGSEISENNMLSDQLNLYNKYGYKIKTIHYKNDTIFATIVYELQDDTLLLSSKEYNSNGSLYLSISYYSNNKGHITKAVYDRHNQKAYDDNRKLIDVEFDKYYSGLFTIIEFENDYKGNVLKSTYITNNNSLYCKYLHRYDFKFNRIETKFYNNKNKLSWRKKMKYNNDGFVYEIKLFESNRIARKSEINYTTDSNGNWIKKVEKRELFPNFFAYNLTDATIITNRIIKYYD